MARNMPNLRKRSSILTYNDDAIYRAIENQRKLARSVETKISKRPSVVANGADKRRFIQQGDDTIPEFVYASDGRRFYPCLFCCHAFAVKELQIMHMQQCTFRVQAQSKPPISRTLPSKSHPVSKPKSTHSTKTINQPRKTVNKTQPFKSNPKLVVQKSKHFGLHTAVGNGAMRVVKQQPKKSSMPKIKLEPGTGKVSSQKTAASTNFQAQVINRNKFTKNMPLQPRLGAQTNQLVKYPRKKLGNTCSHCNIFFENSASLVRHRQQIHTFPKVYVSPDKLQEYDEMYKNSDMSKCTLCAKPVPKIRWTRHLQTHIDEKKHECRVCKKSFGRKDHLNNHEKIHVMDMVNAFLQS